MITLPVRPGTARRLGIRRPPLASRPYGLFQILRPMTSDEVMHLRTRFGGTYQRANPWQGYIVAQPRIRGDVL